MKIQKGQKYGNVSGTIEVIEVLPWERREGSGNERCIIKYADGSTEEIDSYNLVEYVQNGTINLITDCM